MLVFRIPIIRVNDQEASSLVVVEGHSDPVIVTEEAAKGIVAQYNSNPEEIAPVKLGPNTLAFVKSVEYDEKEKCVVAEILLPFNFIGAVHPTQDLIVGNKRRLITGKLVAVQMNPERPPQQPEKQEEK